MPPSPRFLLLALLAVPLVGCTESPQAGSQASAGPSSSAAPKEIPRAAASMVAPPPSSAAAGAGDPGAAAGPRATAAPDVPAPPDVAAPPADAKKTASGLAFKILTPGTGKDHPKQDDRVRVRYAGWTKAGKMFDSSGSPDDKPPIVQAKEGIKGWT